MLNKALYFFISNSFVINLVPIPKLILYILKDTKKRFTDITDRFELL